MKQPIFTLCLFGFSHYNNKIQYLISIAYQMFTFFFWIRKKQQQRFVSLTDYYCNTLGWEKRVDKLRVRAHSGFSISINSSMYIRIFIWQNETVSLKLSSSISFT